MTNISAFPSMFAENPSASISIIFIRNVMIQATTAAFSTHRTASTDLRSSILEHPFPFLAKALANPRKKSFTIPAWYRISTMIQTWSIGTHTSQ